VGVTYGMVISRLFSPRVFYEYDFNKSLFGSLSYICVFYTRRYLKQVLIIRPDCTFFHSNFLRYSDIFLKLNNSSLTG
jgi:hypothetical protein